MEVGGQLAPILFRAFSDLFELRPGNIDLTADRDPSIGVCSRRFERLRSVGGDVNWNSIVEIQKMPIPMQKRDFAGLAAIGIIHGLAVEQSAHYAQVVAKFAGLD